MRIHWTAVYTQEGKEVLGQGDKPSLEIAPIKLIIRVFQLHDGVMSHEAARDLEKRGYQLDHEQSNTAEPAAEIGAIPGYSACISLALPELLAESHDQITHPSTSTNVELQPWQQLKPVDSLEVFPDSSGQLTIRVAESGGTIGEPVGPQTISYERTWHLEQEADQANLAWLLVADETYV